MTTTRTPKRGFSPELRAGIFHFTVFGGTGVSSAYFGIWLTNLGIGADQVGIINALPTLVLLGVNILIGRLADRAKDWRSMIIILALIAGAVPFGMFFVTEFWGILLIWTLCMVPAFSLVPVVDAATLRMTQRNGSDFGIIRGWGTIGYAVTAAASGPLIAWLGEASFIPLFVAFSLLRGLLSLQLPRFRAPEHVEVAISKGAASLRPLLKVWFIFPLLALAAVYSTHSMFSSFAALVWNDQGISEALIGPLVAVSAISEAIMLFVWGRVGGRVSARQMLLIACTLSTVRWLAMAFDPPVEILFVLQSMHAVTFALGYLGGIHFVANWTRENIAAEAQGAAYMLQQAMTVLVLMAFGVLFTYFGGQAFLFAGALCAIGAVLVLVSLRLQPLHSNA